MSATAAATCSAVGGSSCRCRSVIRTQPMSTEQAGAPRRARVAEHELGGPAADVHDQVGAARPAASGRSSAVAPTKDSAASSSPVITSGSTPRISRTPRDELAAVGGVPGRAGGATIADPLDAELAHQSGVLGAARRRCARSASGANRPVGPPPGPSRTTSIRRSTSGSWGVAVGVRTSATSSRRELVPQSMAATAHWPRSPCRSVTVGRRPRTRTAPGRHQSGQQLQRLVAERVDARADGQLVRDQHVQALDPLGHAAGAVHAGGQRLQPLAAARRARRR